MRFSYRIFCLNTFCILHGVSRGTGKILIGDEKTIRKNSGYS